MLQVMTYPVVSEASHLTLEALVEPQRDVVTACLTTRAVGNADIVEVGAAVAAGVALRNAVSVCGGVDVEAFGGAFDHALVLDGVADGLDAQLGEREALETDKDIKPFLERVLESGGDLGAISSSALVGICVPADAVVDAAIVGNELIGDPVLVVEAVGVLLEGLLPDLVQRSNEVRGRVPGGGLGNGSARGQLTASEDSTGLLVGAKTLRVANVLEGRVCQRTHCKGRSGQNFKLDHGEEE